MKNKKKIKKIPGSGPAQIPAQIPGTGSGTGQIPAQFPVKVPVDFTVPVMSRSCPGPVPVKYRPGTVQCVRNGRITVLKNLRFF